MGVKTTCGLNIATFINKNIKMINDKINAFV